MEVARRVNQEDRIRKTKKEVLLELTNNCNEIVRNINLNSAYLNAFFILVLLIEIANMPYVYVVGFLWLFDIQELFKQIKYLMEISKVDSAYEPIRNKFKRRLKLEILDCLIGSFYKIWIIFYQQEQIKSLLPISLIAFAYFLVRIGVNIVCKGTKDPLLPEQNSIDPLFSLEAKQQSNSFYFIINNWIFRIYFVTQSLFFNLKQEGFINWTWTEVFWVFWVFLCIIMGITLIIFLLLVVKTCEYCSGSERELVELQGLIWFFLIMGIVSSNSIQIVLNYCEVLGNLDEIQKTADKTIDQKHTDKLNLEDSITNLYPILYQVIGGIIIQALYFLFLKSQIRQKLLLASPQLIYFLFQNRMFVKLIMFEFQENEDIEEQKQDQESERKDSSNQQEISSDLNQQSQQPQQPQKKVRMAYKSKFILEEKEVIPAVNLPQFVSKVSSTYFKLLTGGKDYQQEMDTKKKIQDQKKPKEQVKQKKPTRLKHRSSKGSSMKNLNRSAINTITTNSIATVNTQGDMLQSYRVNGIVGDQNELEDVFKEENGQNNEKKDLRADNFTKKNMKAINKQKYGSSNLIPEGPKNNNSSLNSQQIKDDILRKAGGVTLNAIQGDSPSTALNNQGGNRRQGSASLFSDFNHITKEVNRTAPFVGHKFQEDLGDHQIKEEEEYDSYIEEKMCQQQNHRISIQSRKPRAKEESESQDTSQQGNDTSENKDSVRSPTSQQPSVINCLVCFDAVPDSIFNPCGHGGLCYECAVDLLKQTAECLLCRFVQNKIKKIDEVLKIDVESRSMGIMKILTSTKYIKVRERIEITEQEYQYYSALQRSRRNQLQGNQISSPLPPLPQHSSPIRMPIREDQENAFRNNIIENGHVQSQEQQEQEQQPNSNNAQVNSQPEEFNNNENEQNNRLPDVEEQQASHPQLQLQQQQSQSCQNPENSPVPEQELKRGDNFTINSHRNSQEIKDNLLENQ